MCHLARVPEPTSTIARASLSGICTCRAEQISKVEVNDGSCTDINTAAIAWALVIVVIIYVQVQKMTFLASSQRQVNARRTQLLPSLGWCSRRAARTQKLHGISMGITSPCIWGVWLLPIPIHDAACTPPAHPIKRKVFLLNEHLITCIVQNSIIQ